MSRLSNQVAPHEFEPVRRLLNKGRCRRCYWPQEDHPREFWSNARPLGDKSAAQPPEPREGIVTVRDSRGRYVGCLGEETWRRIAGGVAEGEAKPYG